MKKFKINKKQIILYALIFIFSALFLYKYRTEIISIKIVEPMMVIPLILGIILFLGLNGNITKVLLKSFNVHISNYISLGLSSINTMGNFIFPLRGGSVLNAVYLKNNYKFSYSKFIASLSAIYVVIFWTNSLFGMLVMILSHYLYDNAISMIIFSSFLFVFLVLTIIMIFSPKLPETKSKFINKFIEVVNNWTLIRQDKKTIIKLIILAIINILVVAIISYFEFRMIGVSIGLFELIILSIFSGFSLLLSITPGSLGIKEAFVIYAGNAMGIKIAELIVISLIDRMVTFFVSLILGIYFTYALTRDDKNKPENNK